MTEEHNLQGTDMPIEQEESYGLEGIILHQSFDQVKGRTIRIDCRERTHIGGANGAGKTSTLSLIPAFYGEEPERIVTRNARRDSFVDYYLPSQQSLIIFEYRRYSGMCCSVMYRHPSGKLCYRFVEGSAADTFFAPGVIDLLKAGAINKEIFDKLREHQVTVSKMVDTITDYRAIIQNNPKLIRRQPAESRRLRAMAADFSLGSRDAQMSHIERLTHVVLNRSRLLSSFKTMICETQFDNIHINSRPKPIDEQGLVEDIKSLKAFEKEEPSIRACLKREAERQSIRDTARVTAANLAAAVEESKEKRSELYREAETTRQQVEELEGKFSANNQARSLEVERKAHAKSVRTDDLNKIYAQRESYEDNNAPELVQEFDNLPEYQRQLNEANFDFEQMTSKVQQLQTEHDRELERLRYDFADQQGKRTTRIQGAKSALAAASHKHHQELSELKEQRSAKEGDLKVSRSGERSLLAQDLARAETLRDNMGQTSEESRAISEAEETLTNAEEAARKIDEDISEESAKRDQARADRDTAQIALGSAEKALNDLREAAHTLKKQIAPASGAWLSQLRLKDPGWAQSLAKVINPALLERADLQPVKVDIGQAQADLLMGWALDLDVLPVPDFAASEEELQERLRELDAKIQQAIVAVSNAERSAQDRNKTFTERQRAVERKETEKAIALNMLSRAREHRDTARRSVESAIEARKQGLALRAKDLKAKIEQFDTETAALVKGIADDFGRRTVERKAQWSDLESELTSAIENAEALASNAVRDHDARIETKIKAYNQQLKDGGIDASIVRDLRNKVSDLIRRIQRIEDGEPLIREYKDWLNKQWSRVKDLNTQIDAMTSELATLNAELAALQRSHNERVRELTEKAKGHEFEAKRLSGQIEEAENTLKKFQDLGESPSDVGFPGNLITLTKDLQSDCSNLDKLRVEVIKAFNRAQTVLNLYAGTQIYQSWQNHLAYRRRTLSDPAHEYDDSFKLKLIDDLRLLLDTDVPHLRSTVVEQFASHAGNLKDYFDSLETMAREVKKVSNQLRQRINTDQQIESISDIRVALQARIEDDESWKPLKAFVMQWTDWHALNPRVIPSDQVISAFKMVTDTLKSASVGRNIESMIDMQLLMKENGREVVIRNDNDFLNASSEGLTYLAIICVFIGMTRYLAPDLNTRITWPVDEIGKLDPQNISRLASMLEHHNLTMVSACPELNRPLRKFFETKLTIKNGRVHNFESLGAGGSHGALLANLAKPQSTNAEQGAPYVG